MLNVVCVRTGNKYPFEDVLRLKNMVDRHLMRPFRFVCITDRPVSHTGVECVDIASTGLRGWWGKMTIFNRAVMPEGRLLYFDLDTVITGDLAPLADWSGRFGICANFTRAAGHPKYPCKYGSCVMSIGPDFGQLLWDTFYLNGQVNGIISRNPYGDQQAIEWLYPQAALLQEHLPKGYFLGYRDLKLKKPESAAVVVFGGASKPNNCTVPWVREEWR
ncbi:MAG: hypothetical protein GWM98_15365 [Nitrospinaceae bacterium]|nr:hypothetical protein [Nitrospinaceae bacterium]NIR55603.1 hypothetical protein [Nitrospinaceae bacterium]NIS86037.1 hypothetical protein [Nitrospinaceae bacterium]NIT82880.1 hypothetical protein [Nitrospinaceae bacterium]NIU45085.1 hypothetical protein [Nitrospinaceae bacterium]